jgi:type VI secretion system protein VasD
LTQRGIAASLLILAACVTFAACGGPPPETIVKIDLAASDTVNSQGGGPARPLRVRIFRLAGIQGFSRADFFSLDGDPKKLLGQDLLGFDDVITAPGGTTSYRRTFEPDAHFVGITAAFAAIDQADWRATQSVEANKTNAFNATLTAAAITFKPGGHP